MSAFGYGGFQLGWNGVAAASAYEGYVYGLNGDNSNYSRGFTGANAAYGVGGFAASSSGGLTNGAGGLAPTAPVKAAGFAVGAGLVGGLSFGASGTDYTQPLQLGKYWTMRPGDVVFMVAKQACR